MKKRVKKLGLHRETLRHLQVHALSAAAGGTGSYPTSCECFIATGCECESQAPDCTLPPSACLASCSC
jgi:hypothetical protein